MSRFIFVTGVVVSSLGKGITAASLGAVLEARGLNVTMLKLDPYINVDPGTMSPLQHGEVFVTADGTETDLDLGHYERFVRSCGNLTRNNNFTRRKIPVSVAYGSDVEKVLKVLEATVKEVENVRSYPPPRIWFDGFGDYSIQFMVWIYVDIDYGFSTMSNVRQKIFAALKEAEIEIPFPQREVRIKSDKTEDLQGAAGLNEEPDSGGPAPDA